MTITNAAGVPPHLFQPQSVVIVGASADRNKLSNKPLTNLLGLGYGGRTYVVNPGATEVEGIASYASVDALPETPDLAFLVVPGQHAVDAATACARRGVKAAIVASTGFAEAGEAGVLRQAALTQLTADFGIRFVGPNTNGLYSAHDRLSLGYNSAHEEAFAPGGVSVVSHSGALFNTIGERLRTEGVGLSKFVAVGNEADLTLLDFVDFMVSDPTTEIILLVLEAISDGPRFRAIAERARAAGKHMAALKLGTSDAGMVSTAAHSSRLAGNARSNAALLKASGVGMVGSVEALVAFARLAQAAPPQFRSSGNGLGLVTASGAAGTILADTITRRGFSVATISPDVRERLAAFNPGTQMVNPLDVASFGGSKSTIQTAPLLAMDPAVEAVIAFVHKLQTASQRETFALGIAEAQKVSSKPHLVIAPGNLPADQRALFGTYNIPIFLDTMVAVEGLAALFDTSVVPEAGLAAPAAAPDGPSVTMNEFDSMAVLERAGIGTVPRRLVYSTAEALAFAEEFGWPVVLKGVVDGIAHKSDVGLVRLNIESAERLAVVYADLDATIRELGVDTPTICVQSMLQGGLEVLVGVTETPPLGRFLLVGQGGRFAEQIDDVHLWAMPASEDAIRSQLAMTTVGRILLGARWGHPHSFDDLVGVLLGVQSAAHSTAGLKAIEINPLSIGESKPVALDALVIVASSGASIV